MPSNADPNKAFTQSINIDSDGSAEFSVYKNATIDTAGTTLTPYNLVIESGVATTDVEGQANPTWSNGTEILKGLIPPNTRKALVGSTGVGNPSFSISQGNNLLIEITNTSGGDSRVAIEAIFLEPDT